MIVSHRLGYILRVHVPATVLLVWNVMQESSVATTRCMKFILFVFVRHKAGAAWPTECTECTTLTNYPLSTQKSTNIATCTLDCVLSLQHWCILCVHNEGLFPLHVLATCPIASSVSHRPLVSINVLAFIEFIIIIFLKKGKIKSRN